MPTHGHTRVTPLGPGVPAPRGPGGLAAVPDDGLHTGVVPDGLFSTWAELDDEALVVVADVAGELRLVWANRGCAQTFGYAEAELVGGPLLRLLRSPFAPAPAPDLPDPGSLVDDRRAVHCTASFERRDGSRLRLAVSSVPVGTRQWAIRLSPAAAVEQVADDLRASHERFQALAGRAPIAIFSSETGLRLAYVNDRFCEMLGASSERLLGTEWLSYLHPDDLGDAVASFGEVLAGDPTELPLRLVRRDGSERQVHAQLVPVRTSGRGAGFVGTLEDVTDRRVWEAALEHQATHDPLTGLPNRRLLMSSLEQHLSDERASARSVALIFLDLDEFKLVNDSLGHHAGDQLLVEVAGRLSGAVRGDDVVARFGGDEFAVLCSSIKDERHAGEVAQRLLEAVTGPAVLLATEFTVSASLGVVVAGGEHRSADDVLRDADVAMYQAKAAGKNTWALFDSDARADVQHRMALVADLRRTLDQGSLDVAYQPVVRVPAAQAGGLVGLRSVEALARWTHPEHGPIPPEEFVKLSEQNGLVVALGQHVMRAACRQLMRWTAELGVAAPGSVAVNVSAVQLRHHRFVDSVAEILAETGLAGSRLCLELTETVVMHDARAAAASFDALRELGVRVSIDDFGTGYSSLALLRRLPVDQLKVDRSLLEHLRAGATDPVLTAVVTLAHGLGLEVVAEGVETQEQLDELRRLDCPLAQGYLFSRPVPPAALSSLLTAPSMPDPTPAEKT
jgi:diguanylate cyclase (GGDEF)-like protein/PAS domain S-box-containing protein